MSPFEVVEFIAQFHGYEVLDWVRCEGLTLSFRATISPRGWRLCSNLCTRGAVGLLATGLTLFLLVELHNHGLSKVLCAGSVFTASAWYAATRPITRTLQISYQAHRWSVEGGSYVTSQDSCVRRALKSAFEEMDRDQKAN